MKWQSARLVYDIKFYYVSVYKLNAWYASKWIESMQWMNIELILQWCLIYDEETHNSFYHMWSTWQSYMEDTDLIVT